MSKKSLIMEKAIELFAENGIEATSVQQITERCGISKGAFYLHFKSKDELIISLIDYFMSSIITDIEQSVRNEKKTNQLLFTFLYTLFRNFHERIHFARIFSKEEAFTFNKDFFHRLQMYSSLMNKMILDIIERQFPNIKQEFHLDLLFTVNGFIKSYTEIFILSDDSIDIDYLCNTIVEKVTVIAEHAKLPFIPPHFFKEISKGMELSKKQLKLLLKDAIKESEEPLIRESLLLLLEELETPKYNKAIIQGLLNNIRTSEQCRWIAYIYHIYLTEVSKS